MRSSTPLFALQPLGLACVAAAGEIGRNMALGEALK